MQNDWHHYYRHLVVKSTGPLLWVLLLFVPILLTECPMCAAWSGSEKAWSRVPSIWAATAFQLISLLCFGFSFSPSFSVSLPWIQSIPKPWTGHALCLVPCLSFLSLSGSLAAKTLSKAQILTPKLTSLDKKDTRFSVFMFYIPFLTLVFCIFSYIHQILAVPIYNV